MSIMEEKDPNITIKDLPIKFTIKYLGEISTYCNININRGYGIVFEQVECLHFPLLGGGVKTSVPWPCDVGHVKVIYPNRYDLENPIHHNTVFRPDDRFAYTVSITRGMNKGCLPAKGLWGMKHTRRPVDALVAAAKNLPANTIPPLVRLEVNLDGLTFKELSPNNAKKTVEEKVFPIESISYGVQDLVYTRVFSMIHVIDDNLQNGIPFYCHSFVCESRHQARQITYALAAAFQEYGKRVKEHKVKKFAIDLRTPEEQAKAEEEDSETEA